MSLPAMQPPQNDKISVIVPVYKEEKNIAPFLERTVPVLESMGVDYEVIFTLDPSPDNTEGVIRQQISQNPKVKLMTFSRRFGQPAATMAGILNCTGDYCVVIDVDLQDQPELIRDMYNKLKANGVEVVYAKRRNRAGETLIKQVISHVGYTVINKISDVKIPRNTGDFRIMSRRVIEGLRSLNESHGFLRGLVAFVGFKQDFIEYDRDARFSGEGNYNRLTGSFKIGLNGIISFSTRPLQFMSIAGFLLALMSFLIGIIFVGLKLTGYDFSPGLPTIVLAITFFSGVQLLSLGLMGEYVGRIYDEVKRRPMFIVDEKVNF